MPLEPPDLAIAWLAGWDAAQAGKPESACRYRVPELATMWERGWVASTHDDQKSKKHFVALSIGVKKQ